MDEKAAILYPRSLTDHYKTRVSTRNNERVRATHAITDGAGSVGHGSGCAWKEMSAQVVGIRRTPKLTETSEETEDDKDSCRAGQCRPAHGQRREEKRTS